MPEQIYARYLKPGEVLFREGEAGDDAYIVEKGEIEISIDLPTDKKVIAELGKGEIHWRDVVDCGRTAFRDGDRIGQIRTCGFKTRPASQTDRSSRPDYAVDDPNDRRSVARCAALDARR